MLRSQYAIFSERFGTAAGIAILLVFGMVLLFFWGQRRRKRGNEAELSARIELWVALGILAVSSVVRIAYILYMPMEPQSDFLRYSTVAQHIASGTLLTEGSAYCDYIVLFPSTIGYSILLAFVYQVFGIPNVLAGLILNAALATASSGLCWRIVRRSAGRRAGLFALALSAFFPSQIMFGNVLASEYLFVFLMMFSLWAATRLFDALKCQDRIKPAVFALISGFTLAIAQNVRAIAGIVLVAAVICLLSMRRTTAAKVPVSASPLACAAVLVASFLLMSSASTASIEKLVDRKLDGGIENAAWNMYVGLNRETAGQYNPEDLAAFKQMQAEAETLEDAKKACLNAVFERAADDLPSLPKLMVRKFENLWGDDGFACDYNIIYGKNTPGKANLLQYGRMVCSLYYFAMMVFAGVYTAKAWRKRTLDIGYIMLLIWLGTIAAHLILENMNRYHYHVLSLLPILAALSVFDADDHSPALKN